MFHMKYKVNRGTSLSMKAAFAVTPLFLIFLAVTANGDEPAGTPGSVQAQGKPDLNRTRGHKATEAREVADEFKAVLESVGDGAPEVPQAQGKPDAKRKRDHKATELQKAIETIVEALRRKVADEHKAVLESVNDGAPRIP